MNSQNHMKVSGYSGIIGSIQFILIPIIAMFYYGGGTAWNHEAVGYTFWQNFLSDLGRTFSYNGVENIVSSPLFNASLGLFGVSLVLLHSSAYRLFSSKLGYFITLSGMISGIGMIIIASAPDNLLPNRHMLGVWIWALFLLVISILIIIHDVSSKEGKHLFVILSVLMSLAVTYHISQGFMDVRGPLVAATQKVVVYLNCVWYLCLSRRLLFNNR
jgi:hypothetical protein